MNIRKRVLIITLGLVALFYCSCSKTPKNIPLVIQGDEVSKRELEDIIKDYPKTGIEYHLQIVKPDPKIDYKIVQIKPDPKIDYKIIIIDPQTGKEIPKLTEEIGKSISKLLQQKREQKKR